MISSILKEKRASRSRSSNKSKSLHKSRSRSKNAKKETKPSSIQPRQRTSIEVNHTPNFLSPIAQVPSSDGITSGIIMKTIREIMDEATLKQIQTYRHLQLPSIRNMPEEECFIRFLKDPFFRAKLECELKNLRKISPSEVKQEKQNENPFGKNTEFIESARKITFKKYKEGKEQQLLHKKNTYQELLQKAKSNDILKKYFHK